MNNGKSMLSLRFEPTGRCTTPHLSDYSLSDYKTNTIPTEPIWYDKMVQLTAIYRGSKVIRKI